MSKKKFKQHILYAFINAEVGAIELEKTSGDEWRWNSFSYPCNIDLEDEFEQLDLKYQEYFNKRLRDVAISYMNEFSSLSLCKYKSSEYNRIQNNLLNEISYELKEFLRE